MTQWKRTLWLLGVSSIWAGLWLLLAIRAYLMLGANPHPFLPDLKITGIMLRAVVEWGLGALVAYIFLGVVFALVGFLGSKLGHAPEAPGAPQGLGYRSGLWMGLGTAFWVHGCLFAMVPGALTTLHGFRRLPIGLVLVLFLVTGFMAILRSISATGATRIWLRGAASAAAMALLLLLPHDLFRKRMPAPPPLPASERRLVLLGIDGLRQDVAEAAIPEWRAPGGSTPIVAVPATRLAWNMLLGGDPEMLTQSFVIPYRREWKQDHSLTLLDAAKQRNISTTFLIDDCTTLSFGLSSAHFSEVREPYGGWRHFFTSGAGFTWPAYSWIENYISPVETTNPWSEPRYFLRDIERAMEGSHWVSSHTCQLHAPFFMRARELQAHDPWKWLARPSRTYEAYQTTEQALTDRFSRNGTLADPALQYAVRASQLLNETRPFLDRWSQRYPNLSGVLTADHGEQHTALKTHEGGLLAHLTGTHGFSLEPDTVKVPLHPFGKTEAALSLGEVFSWFHLRDQISEWIQGSNPLLLRTHGEPGWVIRWPYIRPDHILGPAPEGAATSTMSPTALANVTYLMKDGTWYLKDPEKPLTPRLCYALVRGDGMVTFTPTSPDRWTRARWVGYALAEAREVGRPDLEGELTGFKGGRPSRVGAKLAVR
ncbi:MAG: tetraspanin family protein [Acidobacteria bacterium]|nr:tetraspanin family protein [Acidobacteriota bacterium]